MTNPEVNTYRCTCCPPVTETTASTKPVIGKDIYHYRALVAEARDLANQLENLSQNTDTKETDIGVGLLRDLADALEVSEALNKDYLDIAQKVETRMQVKLEASEGRVAKLREALEWYASQTRGGGMMLGSLLKLDGRICPGCSKQTAFVNRATANDRDCLYWKCDCGRRGLDFDDGEKVVLDD